jgi:hypothetical protein
MLDSTSMWPAPAQLKIGCTKPRAYGDAMGIESLVPDGENG